MARRIILHIGAPKAGSTYLQRVLQANPAQLAAVGAVYPHQGSGHPGNGRSIGDLDATAFAALFPDGIDTVIFSHEDLFALAQEASPLARMARDAGVTVQKLVFMRPWSEFCVGDFSQHLKQNLDHYLSVRQAFGGQSFETMAEARAQTVDVIQFFLRWARVIPIPPLTIVSHRCIRERVEALLGQPGLDWSVPRHLTNPSLRLTDCEAIAAMIDDPTVPEEGVRAAYATALGSVDLPDPARSPERLARIEAFFARQNDDLRAIYRYDNGLAPVTSG